MVSRKSLFPVGNGGLYRVVKDDNFSLVLSFHHIQGAELARLVIVRFNNGNYGVPSLHHRIHIDDADSRLSARIQGQLYLSQSTGFKNSIWMPSSIIS